LADDDRADAPAIEVSDLDVWYGTVHALRSVDVTIPRGRITSLIGPSGCGKSTLLRACNRILERNPTARITGKIEVMGHDVFAPGNDLTQVRKRIGMVFQRPNPLPLSIRDNLLFGSRIHDPRFRSVSPSARDELVRSALERVLLWDDVKDRLEEPAASLALEGQQKLCIARLLPLKPDVLLMDEPCSALDPDATRVIEELLWELRRDYSIVIVTHNMAQARRASEECVFLLLGEVIETRPTEEMFASPRDERTAAYLAGRYG
jgi:phosphate transport system ATP-binding protein